MKQHDRETFVSALTENYRRQRRIERRLQRAAWFLLGAFAAFCIILLWANLKALPPQ